MVLNDKVYDVLKYVGRIVLPALITLVIGMGELWNIPYYEAIAGSIGLIDAFMNTCLNKLSEEYFAEKEENNG